MPLPIETLHAAAPSLARNRSSSKSEVVEIRIRLSTSAPEVQSVVELECPLDADELVESEVSEIATAEVYYDHRLSEDQVPTERSWTIPSLACMSLAFLLVAFTI